MKTEVMYLHLQSVFPPQIVDDTWKPTSAHDRHAFQPKVLWSIKFMENNATVAHEMMRKVTFDPVQQLSLVASYWPWKCVFVVVKGHKESTVVH